MSCASAMKQFVSRFSYRKIFVDSFIILFKLLHNFLNVCTQWRGARMISSCILFRVSRYSTSKLTAANNAPLPDPILGIFTVTPDIPMSYSLQPGNSSLALPLYCFLVPFSASSCITKILTKKSMFNVHISRSQSLFTFSMHFRRIVRKVKNLNP